MSSQGAAPQSQGAAPQRSAMPHDEHKEGGSKDAGQARQAVGTDLMARLAGQADISLIKGSTLNAKVAKVSAKVAKSLYPFLRYFASAPCALCVNSTQYWKDDLKLTRYQKPLTGINQLPRRDELGRSPGSRCSPK